MAKNRTRVGRALIWLFVIAAAVAGLNLYAVQTEDGSWNPKLALDLEGGTQIMLAPLTEEGTSVSSEQLQQAVGIMRQRVNASGVSEAEITTQGGQNIVVSIPGTPDQATRERLMASAKMEFRSVLVMAAAGPAQQPVDPSATGDPAETDPAVSDPAQSDPAESEPAESGEGGGSEIATETEEPTDEPTESDPAPSEPAEQPEPENPSDPAWVTEDLANEFAAFTCDMVDRTKPMPSDEAVVTCSTDNTVKYILGPVEVEGADIADANAGQVPTQQGIPTGEWAVNLEFNGEGSEAFHSVTQRITSLEQPRNQFAVVLDNTVLIAPQSNVVISNGQARITGGYTQEGAEALADQLKFGALPIGFQVQSEENISPRLGESQLMGGLIAGLIGLILVVIYSLFQYRLLGLVTVASLVVAAGLTYLVITLLSSVQGYRLSLAGVTGLMVAIGITADSFIVYFERVRDELRDGKMLINAVESGWQRAVRTILASDAINFLAAAVLYLLAVGNVRGFAFTLGVTTVIDFVVVALFTHPVLQMLARTKFFGGGHPWSGLNPDALGAVYRGRAQFRKPEASGKRAKSAKEATRRQTIAERKKVSAQERED